MISGFQKWFWNWGLLRALAHSAAYHSREKTLHELYARVSLKGLREALDEAEKSNQSFITLAKILGIAYDRYYLAQEAEIEARLRRTIEGGTGSKT